MTAKAMPKYFDLEVSLLEIEPRIWRRFLLNGESTFEILHNAIQDAFGWQRQHLYEFRQLDVSNSARTKSPRPIRRIARCREAEILDDEVVPYADELVVASFFAEKNDRCLYLYDFGDGWQHVVQLNDFTESTDSFTRRLIDGARACPPEDCGGPIGYEELLGFLDMTENQVSKLDEAERPEVEWLREKYRDWKPDTLDVRLARANFDC